MTQSIIPPNRIKQMFRDGQSVIGTMVVEIRQPSIMQLLANAGFHFAIIDSEHGPFTIETIADLSRSARMVGLTPIVRIPEITYTAITQPLDAGAQGIMIPRVGTAQQVRDALEMMKYPPHGKRGSVLGRAHTQFKSADVADAMATANEESMFVVQIETEAALQSLDEILSIGGVDVAFIGPNDLSIALGVPGEMDSPKLVAAIERIQQACARHSVIPAIQMNTLQLAKSWAQRGMRMVSFNSEAGLIMNAARDAMASITTAFREPR